MSKELEAWEKVKEYVEYCLEIRNGCEAIMWNSTYDFLKPFIDGVETTLEDYDTQKQRAIAYRKVIENNENKLKAFEIIKEKRVDITTLMDCHNAEEYNRWVDVRSHYSYRPFELTQEEFDLLKETLL